jgi:hypothetical protein
MGITWMLGFALRPAFTWGYAWFCFSCSLMICFPRRRICNKDCNLLSRMNIHDSYVVTSMIPSNMGALALYSNILARYAAQRQCLPSPIQTFDTAFLKPLINQC